MPYSTVKAIFLDITGRNDLDDAGAAVTPLQYINAGQKLLDELLGGGKVSAKHFTNLTTNQVLVRIGNVMAIKEVWLCDADGRELLIVETESNLKEFYNLPVADEVAGPPEYYAPVVIRTYPGKTGVISTITINVGGAGYSVGDVLTITQTGASGGTATVTHVTAGVVDAVSLATTGAGYSVANALPTTVFPTGGTGCKLNITAIVSALNQTWATQEVQLSGHETVNGIMLVPPVDLSGTYTLEILGLFYSDTLTANDSMSYWTEIEPFLLAWAAAYVLEISYRNTEGAKDWMAAIMQRITQLDRNIVEQEITGISSMEIKIWNTPS